MAKYTINYSCGHNGEVSLYGKHKDRERKIEWMEGGVCPSCYGKEQREKEAALPITATVKSSGLKVVEDGLVCEIVLSGGTINRKDEIKALGYSFREPEGGLMGLLSMSAPRKAWVKKVAVDPNVPATLQVHIDALNGIADEVKNGMSPLDLAMAGKKLAAMEEEKKAIALIEKPEKPACHPSLQGGYWNGKLYGQKGNRNYYLAGKKISMSEEEYQACVAYAAAREEYNAKINKVKKGLDA